MFMESKISLAAVSDKNFPMKDAPIKKIVLWNVLDWGEFELQLDVWGVEQTSLRFYLGVWSSGPLDLELLD